MIRSASQRSMQVHRDAPEIRQKLLGKLGILEHGPPSGESSSGMSYTERKLSRAYVPTPPPQKTIRKTAPRSETQKPSQTYCGLLDYTTQHHEPLIIEPGLAFQQEKKIQFYPQTTIVNIPSHEDYPESIKDTIWNSTDDIYMNGQRNTLEYAADNFDWRKATEEGSFIAADGELYHPETYRLFIAERKLRTPLPPPPPPPPPPLPIQTPKPTKSRDTISSPRRKGVRGNRSRRHRSVVCLTSSSPSLTRFADT